MQVKPGASIQIDCDEPITRWDDSVLAPKNQNIQIDNFIHLANRLYNRKHIFATKRRPYYKNSYQNDELRDQENQQGYSRPDNCQISIFNKYKQKIENIDRQIGRWEEVSHKKIHKVSINNHYFMKVQSGLLKAFTEGEEGLPKSLGQGKLLSQSIDYNRGETLNSRPISSYQERVKQQSILKNKASERSKTIHSKAKHKRSYSKKKESQQLAQFANLTINQLDTGKVKHILRCLSQRH